MSLKMFKQFRKEDNDSLSPHESSGSSRYVSNSKMELKSLRQLLSKNQDFFDDKIFELFPAPKEGETQKFRYVQIKIKRIENY
mgnify:CR=1 FL=1